MIPWTAALGSLACSVLLQAQAPYARIESLGPLADGATLVGGWRVRAIEVSGWQARLELADPEGRKAIVELAAPSPADPERRSLGPLGSRGCRISYRGDAPFAVFEPAGRELVRRLESEAGPDLGAAVARWVYEATTPPRGGTSGVRFGPLDVGSPLADGWTVAAVFVEQRRAAISVGRGAERVVFVVSGDLSVPASPFDLDGLRISYESTPLPWESFAPAGLALAQKLTQALGGREPAVAVREWIAAARLSSPAPPRPRRRRSARRSPRAGRGIGRRSDNRRSGPSSADRRVASG